MNHNHHAPGTNMHNHIREIRKSRGLTLQQLGDLCTPPTTAQTIGRLETGTRTLSLPWIDRIACALGVDNDTLLARAGEDMLEMVAHLSADAITAAPEGEHISPPKADGASLAIRVKGSIGDYRGGDIIWVTRLTSNFERALNRDVLIPRPQGRYIFGRLLDRAEGRLQVIPLGAGNRQQVVNDPEWVGVASRLIRTL